jgi:hypothetical protein
MVMLSTSEHRCRPMVMLSTSVTFIFYFSLEKKWHSRRRHFSLLNTNGIIHGHIKNEGGSRFKFHGRKTKHIYEANTHKVVNIVPLLFQKSCQIYNLNDNFLKGGSISYLYRYGTIKMKGLVPISGVDFFRNENIF